MGKKNNKLGYTLFEILAVIVLLGIILAISIPSVNTTLSNARKSSYIKDVNAYTESVRIRFLRKEISFPKAENELTIVALNATKVEGYNNRSIYNNFWFAQHSYVIVENIGTIQTPSYQYYIASLDAKFNGIYLTKVEDITNDNILFGTGKKSDIMIVGNKDLKGSDDGYLNIVNAGTISKFPKATNVLVYTSSEYNDEYGKYLISFNTNGGQPATIPSQELYDGEKVIQPSNPTKEGYGFVGWAPDINAPVSAKTTFVADWSLNYYMVTFNLNGGSGTAPSQIVAHGGKPTLPPTPTRFGYTFTGWSPSINNPIIKDTTFVANWSLNTYTVSFNLNGGSGTAPNQTVNYGTTATAPANPTRTGYTFAGWSPAISTVITSNRTFTAQWTLNTYTVSFNLNGGSGTAPSQSINHGGKATVPANPTRTGYTFAGWSPTISTVITANTTFTAQWTINTYAVSFNANGGSGAPSAQTKTYGTNLALSSTVPTRSGYRFAGWNTNAAGTGTNYASGATYTSNSAVTLYAKWVLQQQYIYVLNGFGSGGTSSLYGFGTKSDMNLVQGQTYYMESRGYINQQASNDGKELRVFIYPSGWAWSASHGIKSVGTRAYAGSYFAATTGGQMYVTGYLYPSGGGRTGTATWEGTTLYLNSPNGSIWKNIDSGTQLTLPQPQASKIGHNFGGWVSNINGTTYAAGAKVAISAKTSFTAKWNRHTYAVSFNANGGSGAPGAQTKTYGTNLTLTTAKPTRTGYTFAGWNTNSAGTGTNYASGGTYSANAAVTLYAKWTRNTYSVSFNANGGSGAPGAQTKTYGTTLKLTTAKPTRTGHTFAGWNTNSSGTGTNYASGANYTANSAVTLYAKWTKHTYSVSFNANGGSGAPGAQTKTYGTTLKLSATRPTRTYYTFAGWNTNSSGTGTNYASGANYTANSAVTLYAKWTPTAQTVSKVHSTRKSGTVGSSPYDYQVNVTYTATYSGPKLTTLNVSATMQRMGGSYFYNGYTTDALSPRFTVTVNGTAYSYKWNYDFSNPLSNLRTIRGSTNYTVNANVNSFSYTQWDGNFGTFSGSVTIR